MTDSQVPAPAGPAALSVLAGTIQQYAWGRLDAFAAWAPHAPAGVHAELWFGAHPNGPSPVISGPVADPSQTPLLVKLLAAASPLSIQVHPDAEGVRFLSDSSQTADLLADGEVKSEVLIALEDFDVLAGLRPAGEAALILRAGLGEHQACELLDAGDLLGALRAILEPAEGGPRGDGALRVDADAMLAQLDEEQRTVMAKVVQHYRDDPSLPVAFMLRPRTLRPGQAMFVPAGALHAYVDGLGVEVMTSSDNVLRLGLTPKQIAVDAALAITNPALQPIVFDDCAQERAVEGIPFSVQQVTQGSIDVAEPGAIALCVTGTVQVEGLDIEVRSGQATLLHEGSLTATATGACYLARPLH